MTIPVQRRPVAQAGLALAAGRTPAADLALQVIRASYGAALVLVPGPVIRLATGRPPSRWATRTTRVLGARHLVQTAVTAVAPQPATFAIGGQVDTLHAASMLLLAAVSRGGRRAALTDALIEAAFAAAGFSASIYP